MKRRLSAIMLSLGLVAGATGLAGCRDDTITPEDMQNNPPVVGVPPPPANPSPTSEGPSRAP